MVELARKLPQADVGTRVEVDQPIQPSKSPSVVYNLMLENARSEAAANVPGFSQMGVLDQDRAILPIFRRFNSELENAQHEARMQDLASRKVPWIIR